MPTRNRWGWIFMGALSWSTLQTWLLYWAGGFEFAVLMSLGFLQGFILYSNSRLPASWLPRL